MLSQSALITLYYSMIHCHLNYCTNIWGNATNSNLKKLITKQKQAIRVVNKANYNMHTEPLFKKCNILPLYQLIEYSKILFMNSYSNGILPKALYPTWISNQERRGEDLHANLRNNNDLYVPLARTTTTSRLPLCEFPRIWNSFEDESIKLEMNPTILRRNLKHFYISNLNETVTCTRANCPVCT